MGVSRRGPHAKVPPPQKSPPPGPVKENPTPHNPHPPAPSQDAEARLEPHATFLNLPGEHETVFSDRLQARRRRRCSEAAGR